MNNLYNQEIGPMIPYFEPMHGITLVYNNPTLQQNNYQTVLGIGQLTPETDWPAIQQIEETYGMNMGTRVPSDTYKNISNQNWVFMRNAAFIFLPASREVVYFNNEVNFQEDTYEAKMYRIYNALLKILKFNLLPSAQAYFVVLDTPKTNPQQLNKVRFHNDGMSCFFLNTNTQSALQKNKITTTDGSIMTRYAKYTCLEFRDDTVSTCIINPLNRISNQPDLRQQDVIRFWAKLGTTVCIEDVDQQHSTPYQVQNFVGEYGINHEAGNSHIQSHMNDNRRIFRTLINNITDESIFQNLMAALIPNVDYTVISLDPIWPQIIEITPFPIEDLAVYLSTPTMRYQEAGKKYKNKNKKGKKHTKRHNRKTKTRVKRY